MAALDMLAAPASCSSTSSTAWASLSRMAACSNNIASWSNRRGDVFGIALPSRSWNAAAGACKQLRGRRGFQIFAIDAAQEFDFESVKLTELKRKRKLKVGVVGFGNYGQFLAEKFVKQGHDVLAYSRSDYSDVARSLGVTYFSDADDFCEEHPDIVVLCTSILSTEVVLQSLPFQRLKRNTLFVDVLSVKEFPRNLLLQVLPTEFDVLCTHPMFGPESGSGGWAGLPFMFEKVRIGEGLRMERCNRFLNVFESEGCRMVEMSCEEHDRHAAGSQFITHTVGRVLGSLGLESTPIDTKGYESLLKLMIPDISNRSLGYSVSNSNGTASLETVFLSMVDNTNSDSFELYYGLFLYNNNATEELGRLERAFDIVKSQLFDKLHSVIRQQILKTGRSSEIRTSQPPSSALRAVAKLTENILDINVTSSGSSSNSNSTVTK